jgi:hypothetical protein
MPTTYTGLYDAILQFAERVGDTSLEDQIPNIISRAEDRMARDLKILGVTRYVTGTMVAGTSVYQKPADWRETARFNFGTNVGTATTFVTRATLLSARLDYCRDLWPDPSSTGTPQRYADYDFTHWLIAPTPAENYPFEVGYYFRPATLTVSNQTNWYTDYAPDMILYCCLEETALFLQNMEWAGTWAGKYKEAAGAVKGEDIARVSDDQAAMPN